MWPSIKLERFVISTSRSRLPLSVPAGCKGLRPVRMSCTVRFRAWPAFSWKMQVLFSIPDELNRYVLVRRRRLISRRITRYLIVSSARVVSWKVQRQKNVLSFRSVRLCLAHFADLTDRPRGLSASAEIYFVCPSALAPSGLGRDVGVRL